MTTRVSSDSVADARPPAEELDAIARAGVKPVLRRHGVPASMIPDALQEVVFAAHRTLHEKGRTLRVPPLVLLIGIARRRALKIRKSAPVRREVPSGLAQDLPWDTAAPSQLTPEQCAEGRQVAMILRRILEDMPPNQAEVLLLCAEGRTLAEIAADLGVSENTVKSRLALARARARRAIRNLPADERRLVERSPIMALWLLDIDEAFPPETKRVGLIAGLVGLAAGLAGHVGLSSLAPEAQPAIVAEAPSPLGTAGVIPSAPPADPAPLSGPPASAPRDGAGRATATPDTLPAERILITAAERALAGGHKSRALTYLAFHEKSYPAGKLATARERMKASLSE